MGIDKTTIITGLSLIGLAGTTVATAIMAPKADQAIKAKKLEITQTNPEYKDVEKDRHGYPVKMKKEDIFELVKTGAPYYIPTVLLCAFTAGCIIFGHKRYKKELLAMSAVSGYLVANRNKFKEIAEKPQVKGAIKRIWYPEKDEFKHQTIETTGNGDLLCVEGYSGRIFRSSEDAVADAEEKLTEMYIDPDCGYCCLNDFYRFLGIEESQFGFEYGWANQDEEWYPDKPIEFRNELISADAPGNDFGEPVYCIDIDDYWWPMPGWQEV